MQEDLFEILVLLTLRYSTMSLRRKQEIDLCKFKNLSSTLKNDSLSNCISLA